MCPKFFYFMGLVSVIFVFKQGSTSIYLSIQSIQSIFYIFIYINVVGFFSFIREVLQYLPYISTST